MLLYIFFHYYSQVGRDIIKRKLFWKRTVVTNAFQEIDQNNLGSINERQWKDLLRLLRPSWSEIITNAIFRLHAKDSCTLDGHGKQIIVRY